MKNKTLPLNLQFFAEGGEGTGEGQQTPTGQQTPEFDYDKLAQLIAGKQSVTEESVLKGYFKQQGLSKEQMDQAITAFKQQQAEKQPDVAGMQTQLSETQTQLAQANTMAQQAQIQSAATMAAVSLGIDAKTIPYVLKMADLSKVMEQDGEINGETLNAALNKVLEDVPALKAQEGTHTGFVQVGAAGSSQQQAQQTTTTQPQAAAKRWNRWN